MDIYVIEAAGGNPTAIGVLDSPKERDWYKKAGKKIMQKMTSEVEQVGFLDVVNCHFEMAGGEFCGNGTRAAGYLLSTLNNVPVVSMTCSGYLGNVKVSVAKNDDSNIVTGNFTNLVTRSVKKKLSSYGAVDVVEMEGIVHVVIKGDLPAQYKDIQLCIIKELQLEEFEAVGVCWVSTPTNQTVYMKPVVWVRSVNTCFFESACGSGSVAVSAVTGVSDVIQPTGEVITVASLGERCELLSRVAHVGQVCSVDLSDINQN